MAGPRPPRLALVGDRSPDVRAHRRLPAILGALDRDGGVLDVTWVHSTAIGDGTGMGAFDGIWVVPGSPYEDTAGVLAAIAVARTGGIPFLGTCGGFQHALLEYARGVCGLGGVDHAEVAPDAPELLIVPLACSLVGAEGTVQAVAGTRAAAMIGVEPRTERYFCSFGLDSAYVAALERNGLVISAHDADGEVRMVELPGHPFFVASLFQPELSSDETWVHPLLRAFAAAVRTGAAQSSSHSRSSSTAAETARRS